MKYNLMLGAKALGWHLRALTKGGQSRGMKTHYCHGEIRWEQGQGLLQ
jgi:hypothetical protein